LGADGRRAGGAGRAGGADRGRAVARAARRRAVAALPRRRPPRGAARNRRRPAARGHRRRRPRACARAGDGRGALRALRGRRERPAGVSDGTAAAVRATGTAPLAVKRLHPDAVLPTRAYAGDAGLDLHAVEAITLAPGERSSVGTGIAVAIPEG